MRQRMPLSIRLNRLGKMTIIDECSLNGNSTRTFYAPDFLVHLIHDLVSKFCPSLNFHKIYAPSRL